MSWTAVIGAGVSLVGNYMGSQAGEDGADAQRDANGMAIDETRRQFDQTRADLAPWRDAGGWALGQQRDFMEGDYRAALASPDYQAAYSEGMRGLGAGAAANGNIWGGGADADRMAYASSLASQQIGNYYNRLAGMSQTGQGTGVALGQFGANSANQIGGYLQDTGMAQASAYANTGNAWQNELGQAAGWWAYGQGQRNGGGG